MVHSDYTLLIPCETLFIGWVLLIQGRGYMLYIMGWASHAVSHHPVHIAYMTVYAILFDSVGFCWILLCMFLLGFCRILLDSVGFCWSLSVVVLDFMHSVGFCCEPRVLG